MNREEINRRLKIISMIRKKFNLNIPSTSVSSIKRESNFQNGISIIIPTYKGENFIGNCLTSLYNQTLSKELFEIIIIINGELDNTENIIKSYIQETGMQNINILRLDKASASLARNKGIEYATRKFSLFLDDDDCLSENFLEEMYKYADDENTVVVSQIVNVLDKEGNLDCDNDINKEIKKFEGKANIDHSSLLMTSTINACKLIPTISLKEIQFDPELKSGEDVAFFVELFVKNKFKFKIIPICKNVIYYRYLLPNSVSRQKMTFEFNVTQRLKVIEKLDKLLVDTYDKKNRNFIISKINAQFLFVNKYLTSNQSERENVWKEIKKYKLNYLPYSVINKGLAKQLIISYCFPPYVDTSGNVMSKRIRNMNEVIDVVYNKMDRVRNKDEELNKLVDDLIENRFEIASYPSFSNWKAINQFCEMGLEKIKNKKYEKIYSRVMWPGSHFLAYKYKIYNPEVKWIAEFSDPILIDVQGKIREAEIHDKSFIRKANELIGNKYDFKPVRDKNLFFWCEYLAYVFADELVFTNENQLNYMIEYFPIPSVKEIIKEKAVISPQPTLPKEFYEMKLSNYKLDNEKVNLAYFGAFYSTRNLEDLFLGLENMENNLKEKVKLHIFTSNPQELQKELKGSNLEKNIVVNSYVNFYEFLNLTTKFDCLIVNDASTKKYKSINPYLPSKLSDYMGSGTKIWGIFESGSILSKCELDYKSELGNINEASRVFEKIITEKSKKNVQ
jgi:poly(ribitol-phosphate) beta-N-acetylglucosaminyltransferase